MKLTLFSCKLRFPYIWPYDFDAWTYCVLDKSNGYGAGGFLLIYIVQLLVYSGAPRTVKAVTFLEQLAFTFVPLFPCCTLISIYHVLSNFKRDKY